MKKILLGLNAVALPLATVATVVSCNTEKPKKSKKDVVITKPATLGDLQAAMFANTHLKEDLSILAQKNLSNIHAIKAVLKDSMNRYSKREEDKGAVRKFTFDTIIDSMKACKFVEKNKIEYFYFDDGKTEAKTLSVKDITPSVKTEGTPQQLADALKSKEKEFKSYLEKALIIGNEDENMESIFEAIIIKTLNKKLSFENTIDNLVKFTIKQTSDKNDFEHADVVITIKQLYKITLNKLELQTKQVSSSLKKAIKSKTNAFNKETVKLTKEEITDITKVKSILTGLKMNEFGKTYENIINQISKSKFSLNPKSKSNGSLKLTFIGQDSITLEGVKIKENTPKTK